MAVRVTGRVQGVGFRHFVLMRARQMGLSGWVRNEYDGSVRIVARGAGQSIDELVEAVKVGPRSARVDAVDVEPVEAADADDLPESFAVRY